MKSSLTALLDLNTVSGNFNYTVTVVETSSGRQFSLDPVIVNDA